MPDINPVLLERLSKITKKLSDNIQEEETTILSNKDKEVSDVKIRFGKFFSNLVSIKDIIFSNSEVVASHIPALIRKTTTKGALFFIFDFYRDRVDIASDMGTNFQTVNILCSVNGTPDNWDVDFVKGLKDNTDPLLAANIISNNIGVLIMGIIDDTIDRMVEIITSSIENAILMNEKQAEQTAKKKLDNLVQFPNRN